VLDDIGKDLLRFILGLARDDEGVHPDLRRLATDLGGLLPDVVDLCLDALEVFPLQKYQSETRAAMSRAPRDVPPWKISGCGDCSGFGFKL